MSRKSSSRAQKAPENRSSASVHERMDMSATKEQTSSGRGVSSAHQKEIPSSGPRNWLSALCWGLLSCRLLIPAESAAEGDTLLIVLAWCVVGLFTTCWLFSKKVFENFSCDGIDLTILAICSGPLIAWSAVWLMGGQLRAGWAISWEWIGTLLAILIVRHLMLLGETSRGLWILLSLLIPLSLQGIYQHHIFYPQSRALVLPLIEEAAEIQTTLKSPELSDYARRREEGRLSQLQREMISWGIPLEARPQQMFLQRLEASSEPFGMFALANTFAGFLSVGCLLLLGLLLSAWQRTGAPVNMKKIVVLAICLLLMTYCLLLTKSRTAWLGTLAGGFVLLMIQISWRIWLGTRKGILLTGGSLLLFMMIVGIAIGQGSLDREVLTEVSKSMRYRLEYWQATLSMLADHPWSGAGPGNFRQQYLAYKLPESSEEVLDPHNFWLDAWASGGILSLVGVILLIGIAGVLAIQALFKNNGSVAAGEVSGVNESALPGRGWGAGAVLLAVCCSGLLVNPDLAKMPEELAFWAVLMILAMAILRWVLDNVPISQSSVIAASLGLFVHLQAAGGYSMPVVIQWFVILATANLQTQKRWNLANLNRYPVLPIILGGLTLACLFTAVMPKQAQIYAEQELRQARSAGARIQILEQWAAADNWHPDPWRLLAQVKAEQAQATQNIPLLTESIAATEAQIQRDSLGYHGYRDLAARWKQHYEWTQQTSSLTKAENAQLKALERYPNLSSLHLELAEIYQLAGNHSQKESAARKAWELNQINQNLGHTDRLFSAEELARLEKMWKPPEKTNNLSPGS